VRNWRPSSSPNTDDGGRSRFPQINDEIYSIIKKTVGRDITRPTNDEPAGVWRENTGPSHSRILY
jgi:hypothetical protein